MRARPDLQPRDAHNETLLANVHPANWQNPQPTTRYDLVVIGAGTAGLVAAAGAAGLGARVALIERHLMGGDCLNVGCVPSKTLLRSSRAVAETRRSGEFGIHQESAAEVDFPAVMQRVRALRAGLSPNDAATRFRDELGVDVFLGSGHFEDARTVVVEGSRLGFRKALIATGARPALPPIPGLDDVSVLTNENVFSLTELPRRLLVLGGGPIGCELSQAFQRLGSSVTLVERETQFLPREDPAAAELLRTALERDGIELRLGAEVTRIDESGGEKRVTLDHSGTVTDVRADQILVGVGRLPNTEDLDLASAGIEFDRRGIVVDERLRTTNSRVYAAGDVCMEHKFTHAADFAARLVIQNALFFGRRKLSTLTIPWCTYTEPEIAHVGLSEHDRANDTPPTDTFTRSFSEVDRAVIDGEENGFVKIHVRKGSDRILGATIVARHAGDMIGEIALAMASGIGLARIANVIHPYPTQAEAIRQCGDAYNRTRVTPGVKRLLGVVLRMLR
ncbi:MAG: mercuric reductase [Myxococcota bacterium]